MTDARLLPANLGAERLLLGMCMLDDAALSAQRQIIERDDYSTEAHRLIWDAVTALYDAGGSVDRVTLANELMRSKRLEAAGGLGALANLDAGIPILPNVEAYIDIVREKSALRRLILGCEALRIRAQEAREPAQAILDDAGRLLLSMRPDGASQRPISADRAISEIGLDALMAPRRDKGLPLPSDWRRLDSTLCGLHPGQLVLVAGETSRGKTSLALQLAAAASTRTGVIVFSLETPVDALLRRMITQRSRVSAEKTRHGVMNAEERECIREATNWIASRHLWIDDRARTVPAMHAAVRKIRLEHEIGLIVVDYLQLVNGLNGRASRAEVVGGNSRELKLAAMEFGCPLLTLSQVTRDPSKTNRPIELSDLKESGDIENNCDVVLLIRPDLKQPPEERMRRVTIYLAKQREGPRGVDVPMLFQPDTQRFEEIEQ